MVHELQTVPNNNSRFLDVDRDRFDDNSVNEYDHDYRFYPHQDPVIGLNSRYFDHDEELLSSQYLELEVDSFRDCDGKE